MHAPVAGILDDIQPVMGKKLPHYGVVLRLDIMRTPPGNKQRGTIIMGSRRHGGPSNNSRHGGGDFVYPDVPVRFFAQIKVHEHEIAHGFVGNDLRQPGFGASTVKKVGQGQGGQFPGQLIGLGKSA